MNNYNPQRTFIHEVGHYIARELNKSLFQVGEGVEEIFIYNQTSYGKSGKSGGTIPKVPSDYNPSEIKNIPEYIAVLSYGCILQTIIGNQKFSNCFTIESGANGKYDFEEFRGLAEYISGAKRKEIFEYIDNTYYQLLKQDENHFDDILNLSYEEFISESSEKLIVNIDKLNDRLSNFLNLHSKYYRKLIEEIEKIDTR